MQLCRYVGRYVARQLGKVGKAGKVGKVGNGMELNGMEMNEMEWMYVCIKHTDMLCDSRVGVCVCAFCIQHKSVCVRAHNQFTNTYASY